MKGKEKIEGEITPVEKPTIPTWEAVWLVLKQCRIGMNMTDLAITLRKGGLNVNQSHINGVLETMEAFGIVDVGLMGSMKVATLNGKDIEEMEAFISKFRRATEQVRSDRRKGVIDPLALREALSYSFGRCKDCGFPLIHEEGLQKCSGCGATPGEGFQPE